MKQLSIVLLMTLASALSISCDNKPQLVPGQVRTTAVQLGNTTFELEIADSYASRERGLMYRQTMPANHGMLFIFDDDDVLSFWMRNTHIPLDILYLDAQRRIVTIKQMRPLDETGVSSERPAKYAIEINAGMAQKAGIHEGDVVQIATK